MKIPRKLWLGRLALLAAVMVTCLIDTVSVAFAQPAAVRQRQAVEKIQEELDKINAASLELIALYSGASDKNTAENLKPQIDAAIHREETAERALADEMPFLDPNNEQNKALLKKAFDDIEKTDVAERAAWLSAVQRQVAADVEKEAAAEEAARQVINAPR